MYVRNRLIFLICMLVSVVGTVIFLLTFFGKKAEAFGGFCWAVAAIASLLCGALPIAFSSFKAIWSRFVFFSLYGLTIGLLIACIGVAFALALFVMVPGLYAVIGWFRYGSLL